MPKSLRQHLKEHYANESMTPTTLGELCAMATASDTYARSDIADPRGRRLAATCAIAAVIAILAIPVAYQFGRRAGTSRPAVAAHPLQQTEREAGSHDLAPELVAVRLHADWCNHCPQIAPVFERVQREYGMKPVLLVTLDLTDDLRRHQSEQLADAIGVRWVLDQKLHTGTIALVDRHAEEILTVLTDPKEWPQLVSALSDNLPG